LFRRIRPGGVFLFVICFVSGYHIMKGLVEVPRACRATNKGSSFDSSRDISHNSRQGRRKSCRRDGGHAKGHWQTYVLGRSCPWIRPEKGAQTFAFRFVWFDFL